MARVCLQLKLTVYLEAILNAMYTSPIKHDINQRAMIHFFYVLINTNKIKRKTQRLRLINLYTILNSGYALLKSCSCIQSWYCDTLTYTPGTSLSPQPTPQETIPASCHTPFVSHTRGPPPSPLQESLPKLKNMLMMQNHSSLPN